jgi:quercetin dioxygenase-like cupin family protein
MTSPTPPPRPVRADDETTWSGLPADLRDEFDRQTHNPCVGQVLLSEGPRARVWYIRLKPGERLGFHRHVLDYFWTALTAGEAVSHIQGGPPKGARYAAGETRHLRFGPGESMIHDLQNVGSTDLVFVTVEHVESANAPLPIPPGVHPRGLDGDVTQP